MSYAFEMKLKGMQVREAKGPKVKTPADIARDFEDIVNLDREAFFVVTLAMNNKIIDRHLISLGTLGSAPVHPREVFKPAILDSAASIILVHNHPSGDTAPSEQDLIITKSLKEAAEILGIKILDHLIVGSGGVFSFCESCCL